MCLSSGQAESFKKYTTLGLLSSALGDKTPATAMINKVIDKPIEKKKQALASENEKVRIGQQKEDLRLKLHQGLISKDKYNTSLLSIK